MRPVPIIALAVVVSSTACSDLEPPVARAAIEMSASSYVASRATSGSFEYEVTVIARIKNPSDINVRLQGCSTDDGLPQYWIEPKDEGRAAWDPVRPCTLTGGTPYRDLKPGMEFVDTLVLRAPWLRTTTGQAVGEFEGKFFLVYETHPCGVISQYGVCRPANYVEYAKSNLFDIRKGQ